MAFSLPVIDFMGKRRIASVLSITLVVLSLVLLLVRGLNWGLDFTGGSLVEVQFVDPVPPQSVRDELEAAGFTNGGVQNVGTEGRADVSFTVPSNELAATLDAVESVMDAIGAEGITHDDQVSKVSVVGQNMARQTNVVRCPN